MKVKINRRRIFKEAWARFKASKVAVPFRWFLKKVWAEEKSRVAWDNNRYNFSKPAVQSVPVSATFMAGAEDYYRESRRYYGD